MWNYTMMSQMAELLAKMKDVKPPELWLRKMRTLFVCLDIDEDGLISKADCEALSRRFQEYGKLTDEQMKRFTKDLTDWWDEVFRNFEKLNWDQFYTTRYAVIKSPLSKSDVEKHFKQSLKRMFSFINTEGDGIITPKQWRVFFKSMGVDEEKYADESFKIVNITGNGKMNFEEFSEGGFDFMYNDQESVYKAFLGPLAKV